MPPYWIGSGEEIGGRRHLGESQKEGVLICRQALLSKKVELEGKEKAGIIKENGSVVKGNRRGEQQTEGSCLLGGKGRRGSMGDEDEPPKTPYYLRAVGQV